MPEIVTDVLDPTGLLATVNVAVVALAATVTLAGTVAAEVLLLVRVITAPPAGARPVNATVPVELLPPRTEVGLRETELRVAALTIKLVVRVTPL